VGRIPIADESPRQVRRLSASGCPFDTSDRSPILQFDPHRKIVPINVERYFDILRMQERTGWIMKTPDFATGQDEAMDGIWIARPAFKPVAKMDRAKFVFVGSL
jgi:hypothetical protein